MNNTRYSQISMVLEPVNSWARTNQNQSTKNLDNLFKTTLNITSGQIVVFIRTTETRIPRTLQVLWTYLLELKPITSPGTQVGRNFLVQDFKNQLQFKIRSESLNLSYQKISSKGITTEVGTVEGNNRIFSQIISILDLYSYVKEIFQLLIKITWKY